MRRVKKKNKNTVTQRLTIWSIRCSRRGSRLELCWSGYCSTTWQKRSWNERDEK